MSRGKAGAIQTMKEELDRRLDALKGSHEKEKKELRSQWEEELAKKLQSCEKDKKVFLSLLFIVLFIFVKDSIFFSINHTNNAQ
jgi:hypothetical protein